MKPLLSIVTIVKDDLSGLKLTCANVWGLLDAQVEHLIIDGLSSDGTAEFIQENSDKLSYWISEKDSGISDALNKGWRASTADWVLFLNAGDRLKSDAFQELLQALSKSEADVLYANMQVEDASNTIIHANHSLLKKEMSLNHPATFVRRKCFEDLGGFNLDYKIAMDYELLLRLRTTGAVFEHFPKSVSVMNLDGVSSLNWKKGFQEVRKAKMAILENDMLANRYYWRQCFAYLLQRNLKRFGLNRILTFYRSRFSPIRKTSS
jgi:GT2 family glycosyltransferase